MTLKPDTKTKDILTAWIPVENVPGTMYVEAIHDDYEGFRILLRAESPTSKVLRITFEDKLSYRNTDESYLLKIWHSTDKEILGKTFYIVENSSYAEFFYEMTIGFYPDLKVTHYAIYTVGDCIEILSENPPVVEWLN